MSWYRDTASGRFVCVRCEVRAARDAGKPVGVRAFSADRATELREHFRGHRDHPTRLHGDFMPVTEEPLDVFGADDIAELERIAMGEMYYDGACEDVATVFLAERPQVSDYDRARLALHIQQAIEEWLEAEMPEGGEG